MTCNQVKHNKTRYACTTKRQRWVCFRLELGHPCSPPFLDISFLGSQVFPLGLKLTPGLPLVLRPLGVDENSTTSFPGPPACRWQIRGFSASIATQWARASWQISLWISICTYWFCFSGEPWPIQVLNCLLLRFVSGFFLLNTALSSSGIWESRFSYSPMVFSTGLDTLLSAMCLLINWRTG